MEFVFGKHKDNRTIQARAKITALPKGLPPRLRMFRPKTALHAKRRVASLCLPPIFEFSVCSSCRVGLLCYSSIPALRYEFREYLLRGLSRESWAGRSYSQRESGRHRHTVHRHSAGPDVIVAFAPSFAVCLTQRHGDTETCLPFLRGLFFPPIGPLASADESNLLAPPLSFTMGMPTSSSAHVHMGRSL